MSVQAKLERMIKSIQVTTDEQVNQILTQAQLDAQQQAYNITTLDQQKQEQLFLEQQKQTQQDYVISQSKQLNQARKRILDEKVKLIDQIIEESKKELLNISSEQYQQLLVQLVQQCVEMINTKSIVITLCKEDEIYKGYLQQQLTGLTVKFSDKYLSKKAVLGGVIVELENGQAKVDNTFIQRLAIFREQNIDKIEACLFKEHDSSLWEN